MLHLFITIHTLAGRSLDRLGPRLRADRGQSTAEYALVLLGAAAVALLLVAWATDGNKIGELLDAVLERVLDQVS
jgi:hypothetical protein